VTNIIFSDEYDTLPQTLREYRRRAGLSQKQLARRMNRSATHIQKLETRQRRVEIVEFCRFIWAVGGDPLEVFHTFAGQIAETNAEVRAVGQRADV
jgi:transcriptional regulator with XRE-family HTH domain